MPLSQDAKLLLSKHPEICKEIALEFHNSERISYDSFVFAKWEKLIKDNTEPKKDWEIVSISEPAPCKMYVHPKNEDGTFGVWSNAHHTLEEALKIGWGIHSVKRLSDSEVFTVGDSITDTVITMTIKSFSVLSDRIVINGDKGNIMLEYAHKSKPVLFKTEDGFDICEGNSYFSVNEKYWRVDGQYSATKIDYETYHKSTKNFNTKEAAETYVATNAPKYSLNDFIKAFSFAEGDAIDVPNGLVSRVCEKLVKQKRTHA